MDLNAAVQGPDDTCEVLSVSLSCQPDWHTSGLAETPGDSVHDVDPGFFFPTILERSRPFDASEVCVLVCLRTEVSRQSGQHVLFSKVWPVSLS